MSEPYSWREGIVSLYTGTATASAIIGVARNLQLNFQRGWDNRPSLSGVYHDHLTGQRVDVNVQALYTFDSTIARIYDSATAIHLHVTHNNQFGSAGWRLYSGRMDTLGLAESEEQLNAYTLTMHFNAWSAYGGLT